MARRKMPTHNKFKRKMIDGALLFICIAERTFSRPGDNYDYDSGVVITILIILIKTYKKRFHTRFQSSNQKFLHKDT